MIAQRTNGSLPAGETSVNRIRQRNTSDNVVIYGGGMGGAQLAKKLSGKFKIIVVDPLDYFEVPMAAPRNLVQPDFSRRAIATFAEALPDVQHVRAKLIELSAAGGLVETPDGRQFMITGDATVLATGSRFANELVRGIEGTSRQRQAFYARFHERLSSAKRVLIVGGGPIGVEIAGEISETWSDKIVTLIEAGHRLLAGTSEKAAQHAAAVLAGRGVTIFTSDRLENSAHRFDVFAAGGVAQTAAGRQISYDLLLWCVGGQPNTGYLQKHFAHVLNANAQVRVTPELRVVGEQRLFAMGDITDLVESKMAWVTGAHVGVVAANITALLDGAHTRPRSYTPKTGNQTMAITLGCRGGVLHLPPVGVVRNQWLNRKLKADHMLVPIVRKSLGL
jgi:NADH dehydrogenase FAD-containing subunit